MKSALDVVIVTTFGAYNGDVFMIPRSDISEEMYTLLESKDRRISDTTELGYFLKQRPEYQIEKGFTTSQPVCVIGTFSLFNPMGF